MLAEVENTVRPEVENTVRPEVENTVRPEVENTVRPEVENTVRRRMRPPSGARGARPRARRAALAILWVVAVCLTLVPAALASYGRGTWGAVDDKTVTTFGLMLVGGFPLLILILSLIQWRLDKRKEARKEAEKALLAGIDWRGGW